MQSGVSTFIGKLVIDALTPSGAHTRSKTEDSEHCVIDEFLIGTILVATVAAH
jgi:hypothetical protein